jgi:hypothetical protein
MMILKNRYEQVVLQQCYLHVCKLIENITIYNLISLCHHTEEMLRLIVYRVLSYNKLPCMISA